LFTSVKLAPHDNWCVLVLSPLLPAQAHLETVAAATAVALATRSASAMQQLAHQLQEAQPQQQRQVWQTHPS
jgi:aspartate-semialdehyde dehydrogenase